MQAPKNHPHVVGQNKNKERLYYDNPIPKLMGDVLKLRVKTLTLSASPHKPH